MSQSVSSGIESTSSISELSTAIKSPRQSLIDTIPQNLYSTAQRYQQTNKQKLLRKLQTSVKTRRNKIFYGVLCILIFVLSYEWILYLMQDLHSNYNYNQPFFIQYISYSLYSILLGIPLIKPLWLIADKHHKSLINKHNIIISNQYNNPDYTSTPYKFNKKPLKNTKNFTFGFRTKTTKNSFKTPYKSEKKLSSTHSDINSTNSYDYEYDEEYDEYDNDSLLNDTTVTHNKPSRSHNPTHRDSATDLTELGMLSEISFNNIHDTQPSIYKDSYDDNETNFSHSKQSNNTFTNKNGLLLPYFKDSTLTSSNSNLAKIYRQAKSECGPLLDKHEDGTGISLSLKRKAADLKDVNKIIVTSNRDISHIPQSVYFELDLPHRAFAFFARNIGLKTFVFLFVINGLASVLWIWSIANSIGIHFEAFYIENSIHCTRVVICYVLSVICLTNMTSILNLMHCQHLFCLSMLIVGLIAILTNNYYVFEEYEIMELVILGLSPLFNGILFMYLQHISSEYFYKKNFYMFLADIFFILGVNGIVNLVVMGVVLLLSDFTGIEEFMLPIDWDIIWRLLLIAFLWWMYNISLFIGITMLNSLIMGFGFALIIPCNIIFDTNIEILNLAEDKEIFMLIGMCLICLSFVIYEMQFYVWYVMYCGTCRSCCVECRTSCIRWIHKKTQYKLYGQFQCCCTYRCCCCY